MEEPSIIVSLFFCMLSWRLMKEVLWLEVSKSPRFLYDALELMRKSVSSTKSATPQIPNLGDFTLASIYDWRNGKWEIHVVLLKLAVLLLFSHVTQVDKEMQFTSVTNAFTFSSEWSFMKNAVARLS